MRAWRHGVVLAVALLAATAWLGGCGGGGGADSTGGSAVEPTPPPVGPIPAAEFATVPPPTFGQAVAAFRAVTAANPALLNDEPALSRALFDEIRRATINGAAGKAGTAGAAGTAPAAGGDPAPAMRRQALFDLGTRMTLEAWKLVIRSPIQSARAATTIEVSAQAAIDAWPCDADVGFVDGKADALRHAYWNALMTRRTGAAFAERFATAHETGSTNAPEASAMDLHNNAFGRALAQALPAATEAQLLPMLLQQAYTYVPAGAAIPGAAAGLVYIAERARRPFDGTWSGTFTAPDTGAPAWNLDLDLAQCGAAVHGRLRATRGTEALERRFSGTLDAAVDVALDGSAEVSLAGSVTLALAVADPLAFEPLAGPGVCLGLQAALSGNERELVGPWTSGSCPQGGIITLRR